MLSAEEEWKHIQTTLFKQLNQSGSVRPRAKSGAFVSEPVTTRT